MIDRRSLCIGTATCAFAARADVAVAMPSIELREAVDARWKYAQALPPAIPPPKDYTDQKAFGQYLSESAYGRIAKAGVEVADDAKADIQQAVDRSADAAFRPQKGKIQKGETFDALQIDIRRVVILRNFNTFTDVLIAASREGSTKLTKEVVNRVQGFICPLYPICTG